ncbi:MAG: tyrosine--tRNA ligase [Planctomycetes bacterium]|nr:tyrosine--tRNA ligase [Planctomycetota bacterium]
MHPSIREQMNAVHRGTVAIHTPEELERKLVCSRDKGKPLRIKLGVDPTSPDIHLGHTVVLQKLRQFQDLGHQAVLIIGDFTALVGDPSGRKKTRPQLTPQEVETNAKTYLEQVGKVLDTRKLEVVRNSAWLRSLSFHRLLELSSKMTVARLLERDDFAKRHKEQVPVFLHEFLYVLMQAYDSVEVRADVELGGTDQTFNLLAGRDLMRDMAMEPQVALTMPILPGLDGKEKMSKSLGNHVGVTEDAYGMYGKIMSLPDAAMRVWFTLVTRVPEDEIERYCDPVKTHPKAAKDVLARKIIAGFHGEKAADEAAARFDLEHRQGKPSEDIPELKVDEATISIVKLVILTRIPSSNSDARRLVEQGGVEVDGRRVTDPKAEVELKGGELLKVGKKNKFFRIVRTRRGTGDAEKT